MALPGGHTDTDLRPGGWLRPHADQLVDVAPAHAVGRGLTVGVLALQGAFAEHAVAVRRLGASVLEVRTPAQLEDVDALIMPGGESTTMSKLLVTSGLFDPIARRIGDGMAVFGTCAGMILLADDVLDGRPDQRSFAAIGLAVRRNGYGRQIDSFEADLDVDGFDEPFRAVFIRAPLVEQTANDVQVLARWNANAVLCRRDAVMTAAFHPELTADVRIHALFLKMVESRTTKTVGAQKRSVPTNTGGN